jgi:predicted kinase
MDLDSRGHQDTAQTLMEAYVQCSGDRNVFVLLDFYKCYRAFVRMKVECLRLRNGHLTKSEKHDIMERARHYMGLAYRYAVQFTRPTLWVVCGMAASGKTTIAGELAKTLNVKVFHSDKVRKTLFQVPPEEHGPVAFEAGIYSKGATALTYGKLLLLAQEELEKGYPVILDATYSKSHDRMEVRRLSRDQDVNVLFVECACSDSVMKNRLEARKQRPSDSDARLQHFERLKKRYEPLEELPKAIHFRVDTEKPVEENMTYILASDYALLTRQTMNWTAV